MWFHLSLYSLPSTLSLQKASNQKKFEQLGDLSVTERPIPHRVSLRRFLVQEDNIFILQTHMENEEKSTIVLIL